MYGVVANVVSDNILRPGARVWIADCNGDATCPIVYGLNKKGRVVKKYTNYKRLTNFRAAWIPGHMRDLVHWAWPEKAEAEGVAKELNDG